MQGSNRSSLEGRVRARYGEVYRQRAMSLERWLSCELFLGMGEVCVCSHDAMISAEPTNDESPEAIFTHHPLRARASPFYATSPASLGAQCHLAAVTPSIAGAWQPE